MNFGGRNNIHSTVVIEGDVQLGTGNIVGPYTVLRGPLMVGDNNVIHPHTVIGSVGINTAERFMSDPVGVAIGDECEIGEFVSLKAGHTIPTRLHDCTFIGSNSSVGHDSSIGEGSKVLPGCTIAGHVRLLKHTLIGIGSTIRQRVVVGSYSTVAMGALILESIPPLALFVPGRGIKTNVYNLDASDPIRELVSHVEYADIPWTHPILAPLLEDYFEIFVSQSD